jgi:very-short-patch-repair endonuclease
MKASSYPACGVCGKHHRYGVSHEAWLLWKERLSASTRNYVGQAGTRHSPETRKKIGDANRGRRHTEETKRKCSEASRLRVVTPELRARLSETTTALWRNPDWVRRARRGRRVTSIEKIVYVWLNELGVRFFREQPIVEGVIDIWCPDFALGIETDGEYWHPPDSPRDHQKDYMRAMCGLQTIRLREREIVSGAARAALLAALHSQRSLLEDLYAIRPTLERTRMLELVKKMRDAS